MRNWKKKDRRVPRRTSVMSMTLSSTPPIHPHLPICCIFSFFRYFPFFLFFLSWFNSIDRVYFCVRACVCVCAYIYIYIYIGYANQIRNLTGAAGQILRFLGQIDDTGEHIGSTDVRTAASAFSCPESDVEDALSMFKMAKEAEQKENKRDMSKTREGNIKEAFPTCFAIKFYLVDQEED
ncbi:hypothetical protein FEM48_Zijuj02G0157600 [Ziziphus jujuba var. spinosa]|uniref:Uncharacterized protein n=1 Tax=Ziziphus jujuba var. spinosa TaxID=714518 RepID=A0A978VWJ6_ZIZJJ|nr:hypothetical protein FEM48_Zijuj02G0157600 [Ziziphus jujuba var. spinosa]